jgi:hypothetical protein
MSPIYCKKDSFLKIFQFLTSNFYSDWNVAWNVNN